MKKLLLPLCAFNQHIQNMMFPAERSLSDHLLSGLISSSAHLQVLKPDEAAAKRHHAESTQALQQTQEKRQLQVRQEVQRLRFTHSVVAGAHQTQYLRGRGGGGSDANTRASAWNVVGGGGQKGAPPPSWRGALFPWPASSASSGAPGGTATWCRGTADTDPGSSPRSRMTHCWTALEHGRVKGDMCLSDRYGDQR